jgi:hypothetical protein
MCQQCVFFLFPSPLPPFFLSSFLLSFLPLTLPSSYLPPLFVLANRNGIFPNEILDRAFFQHYCPSCYWNACISAPVGADGRIAGIKCNVTVFVPLLPTLFVLIYYS